VKYHYFYRSLLIQLNGDWGRFVGPLFLAWSGRPPPTQTVCVCARVCAWRRRCQLAGWLAAIRSEDGVRRGVWLGRTSVKRNAGVL